MVDQRTLIGWIEVLGAVGGILATLFTGGFNSNPLPWRILAVFVGPEECGVRQRPPPTSPAVESILDGRNPLVAALLSALFPGLGHIYAREIEMGLFFAVSFVIAVLSLFVLIGIVLVPAIWLYALYDAAKSAQRRDDELATAHVTPGN